KDFVFIGFEGRADRPLGERRIKRSPLSDVANMLLSMQYAAQAVLFDQVPGVTRRPQTTRALEFWASYWRDWVSALYLKGYFEGTQDDPGVRTLLDAFIIERALEEMTRETIEGSEGVRTPVRAIAHILDGMQ